MPTIPLRLMCALALLVVSLLFMNADSGKEVEGHSVLEREQSHYSESKHSLSPARKEHRPEPHNASVGAQIHTPMLADGPAEPSPSVVMLVDQHTLDTYLAACAIGAGRVYLVYAAEMEGVYDVLATHLGSRLSIQIVGVRVKDDMSYAELGQVLQNLPPDAHLHYTGGTGALSAHARMHFDDARPGKLGSCLDEERRLLRYDDGRDLKLRELIENEQVCFDDIARLQGYRVVEAAKVHWETDRGARDALVVASSVMGVPIAPGETRRLADMRFRAQRSHAWRKFLDGRWLEVFIAACVQQVVPDYELLTGVRLKRGHTTFELDVVAVGRYHPYVVSCTTSGSGSHLKHKLFEVKERTRRLAGAVGRPAVASLCAPDSRPSPRRLREDLADLWDNPAEPIVFDRFDISNWVDALRFAEQPNSGKPRGFRGLAAWLTS